MWTIWLITPFAALKESRPLMEARRNGSNIVKAPMMRRLDPGPEPEPEPEVQVAPLVDGFDGGWYRTLNNDTFYSVCEANDKETGNAEKLLSSVMMAEVYDFMSMMAARQVPQI